MFWADELAARCSGPQVLNDSKTPSGTVHVGSLRGPVINDVIVRALRKYANHARRAVRDYLGETLGADAAADAEGMPVWPSSGRGTRKESPRSQGRPGGRGRPRRRHNRGAQGT